MPLSDLPTLMAPGGPQPADRITPQREPEVEEYAPSPSPQFREFGDSDTTRRLLFENTLAAAQAIEPVSNPRHTLSLTDVGYHGPENFSIAEQKQAILSRGTLARPLRGTWVLSDAEGNEVGRKKSTLAKVPWLTNRGTFIMNGSEYTMAHQMRLRPGVFTRVKDNGELEAHVNVSKGFGHRIFLDPETGVFRISMGQARMPLIPLLRAQGVTDAMLRDAWGNDLTYVNAQKDDPSTIKKLHGKLYGNKEGSDLEQKAAVVEAFSLMELDPAVTKQTLGQEFNNVGPETLLAITRKLLAVSKGEADPDDRDALAYQHMLGPEDMFAERLKKAKGVAMRLLWRSSGQGNLDRVNTGAYEDVIRGALLHSGLGQCFDAETCVLTRRGFIPWPQVVTDDEFACQIGEKLEYHRASQLYSYDYDGSLLGCRTKRFSYLVTPNHRLWCKAKAHGAYRAETAEAAHGRQRFFDTGLPMYVGVDCDFVLPPVVATRRSYKTSPITLPGDVWAEFLGWYISEGWVSVEKASRSGGSRMRVCLSQDAAVNPEGHAAIVRVLNLLPFKWKYNGSNKTFFITSKQLATELLAYGHGAENKCIPRYCFGWTVRRLRLLAAGYFGGDGNEYAGYKKSETTSRCLANDTVELCGRLGLTGRWSFRELSRKNPRWRDSYVTSWGTGTTSVARSSAAAKTTGKPDPYFSHQYRGRVYCAAVPGERLYVLRDGKPHWSSNSLEEINPADIFDHQSRVTRMGEGGIPSLDAVPDEARGVQPTQFGFIDFLRTPESSKVGIDARMARAARKGKDGRIYTPVIDRRGQTVYKSPQDLVDVVVAFPNSMKSGEQLVPALVKGKVRMMPRQKVDYEIPDMESTFSPLGNMIPLKSMVKGQRAVMAARMLTQALPLVDAEAPLVQSGIPGQPGRSFEEEYANHMGSVRASSAGRVVSVGTDSIQIVGVDGKETEVPLYDNFPYNRKTFLHNTAVVRAGDTVQAGQLLATSNFTDGQGVTALGKNARVAYIPFEGLNFEDANVVSESFAKKMSSEHMYQHGYEWDKKDNRGRNAFLALFPSKYDRKTLDKFDDSGFIKPGTEVKYGDPLVLVARERERNRKSLLRGRSPGYTDETITWDHHSTGIVTDVVDSGTGIAVVVKATAPLEVGDKISGRYGDKGIVSRIFPDDEMPRDTEGQPYEVLLNPLGVISRTNPAQIVEAALGKIAAQRGEAFKIPDFQDEEDLVEFALKELRKAGLDDTESIVDAATGRRIDDVFTGNRWFMKLHHTAESKGQGRGIGGYTADQTPAKGGVEGAKRIGMLEVGALLAHGATEFLRGGSMIRGQASPEYWAQYMSGHKPPTPKIPYMYRKYVAHLKASGINVVRQGTQTHIMALTDSDIDRLAGSRELRNVETVNWKTMEPIKGGLFDRSITGGHGTTEGGGNRWSYIKLQEPLPNPVMEEPIRRVLGLTKSQLADVISGEKGINGVTGPTAIAGALKDMNLDKEIARAREEIKSGKKTARDTAVRRLGYLRDAKRLGIHPRDWILSKVPVLPPAFRPVSTLGKAKMPLVADPNYLYKEVWDANKNLKEAADLLGDEDLGSERLALYDAFKAVTGLGDPTHPKNQERKVKGILRHVFGSSPKLGMVQRQLLSSTVDMVGRSVIAPDPDLDMDQVGIPEEQAWRIYRPIITRRLVRKGWSRREAARAAEERQPAAREALLEEMESGVVVINRAPTLHRYGMMAARPRLVKGDVLKVSPLVVGGFNADFDGDAMQYHVPTTDAEKQEAIEKMLPSRNLFAAADFGVHYLPSQEYVGGLYEASARVDEDKKPAVFATAVDAVRAYKQGRIGIGRKIEILED